VVIGRVAPFADYQCHRSHPLGSLFLSINNRQDTSSLPSEKSPVYQGNGLRETGSVSYSTVPGTVINGEMHQGCRIPTGDYNESQISSIGGTPRWVAPMPQLNTEVGGPPSQVEHRRTAPITTSGSSDTGSDSGSQSTPDLEERFRRTMSDCRSSNSDDSVGRRRSNSFESVDCRRSNSFESNDRDGYGDQNEQPHDEASNSSRHCDGNGTAISTGVLRNVTNLSNATEGSAMADVPEWDGCRPSTDAIPS